MKQLKNVFQKDARVVGVFGLSHKSAPLKELERVLHAYREDETTQQLRDHFDEITVLKTCNRLEIYFAGKPSLSRLDLTRALRRFAGRSAMHVSASGSYIRFASAATRHLYAVASGIDSMVIGETDILSQIKEARLRGLETRACGPLLKALFVGAEAFGKEIRERIAISRGVTSVADLAVRYLECLSFDLCVARVLVIGAGRISSDVALRLAKRGLKHVCIVSRTRKKALALRAAFSAASPRSAVSVGSRASLPACLTKTDIVVAAATANDCIVRPDDVPEGAKNILFLDFGMPRNIDPAVADRRRNISIVTMDDFVKEAGVVMRQRKKLVPAVRKEILAAVAYRVPATV